MWLLYQLAIALALLLAGPVLLARRGGHYRTTLPGRLARRLPPPPSGGRPLWLHAVSVGEVGVAATLARELPATEPLLVTTITPTGQARARAAFAERIAAGTAAVAYLPFDLAPLVERFLRHFEPRALVLVEGDYWPLVLRAAERRGLPVAVVNGRVGDASFRRLARLRRWTRWRLDWRRSGAGILAPLFRPVHRFCVQGEEDRRRLVALGVDPERVAVTGNLKYDTPEPPPAPEAAALVRRLAAGRPVLVAGSTMGGEEEAVLAAFAAAGGGERALLVLAPRHPERWDDVERLARRQRVAVLRRSAAAPVKGAPGRSEAVRGAAERGAAVPGAAVPGAVVPAAGTAAGVPPAVLLLDSMGELAALYRGAAAAFVGGTLTGTGGHNPLEPARFGVATAVGPSMENFREMAVEFDAAEAWHRVAGADELGRCWRQWLDDPGLARVTGDAARDLVEANRGAAGRTAALLREALLAEPGGER